ncbi:MAG: NADH-quinone oxidoreductase subunit NuoN [Neisseria sp.]|mgnify:CR=1 FL=1
MNWNDLNLIPAMPEIVLLSALGIVLLADLWISDKNRYITHILSLLALVATAATQIMVWSPESVTTFNGMYVADGVSQLTKMVLYAGVFTLFVYSQSYNKVRNIFKGEYYTLSLFALIGMSVMVSAGHFLTGYIGLELLSLALYAMIALRRDSAQAAEAALKYFILGALASGLLLYGISMVYGATGLLTFDQIAAATQSGMPNEWLLKLGVVFIVVGIAFKFGAVPFHMWVPDVYQGAPTSVAALIGSVPKIAATVFAFRILVTALGLTASDWLMMFNLLAIASLLIGNLVALMQTNIKRMLAYSTISHMGFILLAFMGRQVGIEAALYYALAYVLMSVAAFGVLMALSDESFECENISDLAGLNQRNAWYAFIMLLVMFSMAGIPPLMGFYAKLVVIKALLSQGYIWVAVFAVVMSLIGAFYYLRVVKSMYFDNTEHTDRPISGTFFAKILLSVNALLLLVWGVFPESVMQWVKTAVTNVF